MEMIATDNSLEGPGGAWNEMQYQGLCFYFYFFKIEDICAFKLMEMSHMKK